MKKALTIISCFIIIIIILLTILLQKQQKEQPSNIINYIEEEDISEAVGTKKIEKLTSRDDFYIVENCIKKYIKYIQDKEIDKVYSCLDEEFLKQEDMTKDKIIKEIANWKTGNFIAEKIYVYDDTETISEYFVAGLLENKEYYSIVKIDYDNETFSVLPNYYIEESTIGSQSGIKIIKIK